MQGWVGHPCSKLRPDRSLLVLGHMGPACLPTLAASETLTWRSPTSAPWTGSCWAQRLHPARRPSGSVALPSRLPSSLPGTMSGSSSTLMPPAPARPRASVSHTSEVTPAMASQGTTEHSVHHVGAWGQSSTPHLPAPRWVSSRNPIRLRTVVGWGPVMLLPQRTLESLKVTDPTPELVRVGAHPFTQITLHLRSGT